MPPDYLAERQEVLDAVRRIVSLGLVAHASGNVSRRIHTPDGTLYAVTASRVPYHRFGIDDVLVVDADVEPVVGDGIPSSESLLHLPLYPPPPRPRCRPRRPPPQSRGPRRRPRSRGGGRRRRVGRARRQGPPGQPPAR